MTARPNRQVIVSADMTPEERSELVALVKQEIIALTNTREENAAEMERALEEHLNRPLYTVGITVTITDEDALYAAAKAHMQADNPELDPDEYLILEDEEEGRIINVSACLVTLFDPGVSPAGCEIEHGWADPV